MKRTIVLNRARCTNCGEVLTSKDAKQRITCVCHRRYINKLEIDFPEEHPDATEDELQQFIFDNVEGLSIAGGDRYFIRSGNLKHLEDKSIYILDLDTGDDDYE